MENIVKMSMDGYMESLAGDIEQIKAHPEKGCCDAVEVEVLENVLGIMNSHFSDYDTLCSENKAMAEFLASLGYSQEQVTDIANGGKPKRNFSEKETEAITEACKRSALETFYSADDAWEECRNTEQLWLKAGKGELQVCSDYEHLCNSDVFTSVRTQFSMNKDLAKEVLNAVGVEL